MFDTYLTEYLQQASTLLTADELAYVLTSARCRHCRHLTIFHALACFWASLSGDRYGDPYQEINGCRIPGCRCEYRPLMPEPWPPAPA